MVASSSSVYERAGNVVLVIAGHYTTEQAQRDVLTAFRLFKNVGRCEFIPDLSTMTGYDSGARTAWQEVLAGFQRSIHTVTMVGGSPLARMSGAAVCLYAGIKMRFVDELEQAFPNDRPRRAS